MHNPIDTTPASLSTLHIVVIIPAVDEENSIGLVVNDIPDFVQEVIVVDNASRDRTAERAREAGATVLREDRPGYGSACLCGLNYALSKDFDIVVFLDGDYSDHPEEMPLLLKPIIEDDCDLVIGSRARGARERGAMPPQARFGNWLATRLIRLIWGYRFTDLGPFRAVTVPALKRIGMEDTNFGWTVEMQIKAAQLKMKTAEVPVRYRKRIGFSKVSGTLSGTIRAGWKILYTIAKYGIRRRP